MWNNSATLQNPLVSNQSITMEFYIHNKGCRRLTCIYAKCDRLARMDLWNHIIDISSTMDLPWLVAGDFNIISSPEEKRGGAQPNLVAMQQFNECIMDAGLTDAGFQGNKYTWSNNQQGYSRIWERLDRVLINGESIASSNDIKVTHLARIASDHSPLLIQLTTPPQRKGRFIFQRMWTDHMGFYEVVKQVWHTTVAGPPGFRFCKKLGLLRHALKQWNKKTFGILAYLILKLQSHIEDMEAQLQDQWSNETNEKCQQLKTDLHQN